MLSESITAKLESAPVDETVVVCVMFKLLPQLQEMYATLVDATGVKPEAVAKARVFLAEAKQPVLDVLAKYPVQVTNPMVNLPMLVAKATAGTWLDLLVHNEALMLDPEVRFTLSQQETGVI